MALLIRRALQGYNWVLDELADPRTEELYLMKSPLWFISIFLLYFYIILDIGPKFMKNRKPFNLDKIILCFNAIQVAANAYIFINLFKAVLKLNLLCSPIDYSITPENMKALRMVYLYYILKITDLLDTVFFVLRKNERQLTFLHLYHHSGMILLSWVSARFVPGGQTLYLPFVNSFVHVVMYLYYFITVLNPKYKQNIWWKKYITQIQLAQVAFVCFVIIAPLLNSACNYPKILLYLALPHNVVLFFLFCGFYIKNYLRMKKN